MDGGRGAGTDDGGARPSSFVRPFLDRTEPSADDRRPPPGALPVEAADQSAGVRPYYLTGGRVGSGDSGVRVETIVVARSGASRRLPVQAWEQVRLMALAAEPTSVVELAVAMGVPVGVALVLVGDLARGGLLDISAPVVAPRDDVALIRRLIDGVYAL
jgi:hypothetical protein